MTDIHNQEMPKSKQIDSTFNRFEFHSPFAVFIYGY